jgi:hypothetical protein
MNKDILESRKKLRELYIKFSKEFYEINMKMDKYLEMLQDASTPY